ncbi:hypothetical protein JNUCC64_08455 [Streptomyces sp. JNUCC 64]
MKTTPESLVRAAARDNAEWCAAMSRTHGVAGAFGERVWTAPVRTPPYYPDAVTLAPGTSPDEVLAGIDSGPGATVKDSFADLDLTAAGFRVLFEARWIHRPAGPPATAPRPGWEVVDGPRALHEWALAQGGPDGADLFRPALLDDPAVLVLAGRSPGGRVTSGAVLSHGGEVLGVSNVFADADADTEDRAEGDAGAGAGAEGGPAPAWPGALAAAHRLFPGLPVVGYEHGEDLAAALRHGFAPVGPLRIWLRG